MDELCIKCGKPANLMCCRCFEAYCSENCQISDWKEHKKSCIAMPALVSMSRRTNLRRDPDMLSPNKENKEEVKIGFTDRLKVQVQKTIDAQKASVSQQQQHDEHAIVALQQLQQQPQLQQRKRPVLGGNNPSNTGNHEILQLKPQQLQKVPSFEGPILDQDSTTTNMKHAMMKQPLQLPLQQQQLMSSLEAPISGLNDELKKANLGEKISNNQTNEQPKVKQPNPIQQLPQELISRGGAIKRPVVNNTNNGPRDRSNNGQKDAVEPPSWQRDRKESDQSINSVARGGQDDLNIRQPNRNAGLSMPSISCSQSTSSGTSGRQEKIMNASFRGEGNNASDQANKLLTQLNRPRQSLDVTPQISAKSITGLRAPVLLTNDHFKMTDTSAWKTHFEPPKNAYFDGIVQFVEGDNNPQTAAKVGQPVLAWIAETKHDEPLRNLLIELNSKVSRNNPLKLSEINVGCLVVVPFSDILYRAEIINIDRKEPISVAVRLIDYGNVLLLPLLKVYKPTSSMYEQKAYAFRVHLQQRPVIFDIETQVTLRIVGVSKINGEQYLSVELKDMKNSQTTEKLQTLNDNNNNKNTIKVEACQTPLPPSPPDSVKNMKIDRKISASGSVGRIYTIGDVKIDYLAIDTPLKLYVIDASDLIKLSFLHVMELRYVESIPQQMKAIEEHCSMADLPASYSPIVGELCLAIYGDDKQWYRAQCLTLKTSESFAVYFIDYGNTSTVTSSQIRPITPKLLYPLLTHKCFIDGDDKYKTMVADKILESSMITGSVTNRDESSYWFHLS